MPLICLASPKGGVGKTSLAAGIAAAIRASGRRVLAIDLDPQNALRLHLGMPIGDTGGFLAELQRRTDWRRAMRPTPSGIDLLPYGETDMRGALATGALLEREPDLLAAPLRAMLADPSMVVVADTPPGASQALAILLPQASLVVAVLLADAGSTALLPEIETGRFLGRGTLGGLFAARLRIVLNQVDRHSRLSVVAAEAMAAHFGPRLLGAVCRDDSMAEALACQQPVGTFDAGSAPARDITDIAAALLSQLAPSAPSFAWGRS